MRKALIILSFLTSPLAFAGVCEIFIERSACPGQEKAAYVKCGGKQGCSIKRKASDVETCKKLAEAECANSRVDITKSKIIKVKFGSEESANLCAADRPDYNKCD